jgi:hypothetical protein
MIMSLCYVAVCLYLIIYFITWYTIDRREEESDYDWGYLNITDNSTARAGHS